MKQYEKKKEIVYLFYLFYFNCFVALLYSCNCPAATRVLRNRKKYSYLTFNKQMTCLYYFCSFLTTAVRMLRCIWFSETQPTSWLRVIPFEIHRGQNGKKICAGGGSAKTWNQWRFWQKNWHYGQILLFYDVFITAFLSGLLTDHRGLNNFSIPPIPLRIPNGISLRDSFS